MSRISARNLLPLRTNAGAPQPALSLSKGPASGTGKGRTVVRPGGSVGLQPQAFRPGLFDREHAGVPIQASLWLEWDEQIPTPSLHPEQSAQREVEGSAVSRIHARNQSAMPLQIRVPQVREANLGLSIENTRPTLNPKSARLPSSQKASAKPQEARHLSSLPSSTVALWCERHRPSNRRTRLFCACGRTPLSGEQWQDPPSANH